MSPERTTPLWVATWLWFAVSVVLASAALGSTIAQPWELFAWPGTFLFTTMAIVMSASQWFATYRGNSEAVGFSAVLAALIGGCAGTITLAAGSQFYAHGEWLPLGMALPLGMVMTISAYVLVVNIAWRRQLRRFQREAMRSNTASLRAPPVRFTVSLGELLGVVTLMALGLGVVGAALRSAQPQVAEHVETDHPPFGIPAGARDICWRQDMGVMRYEFTIDEAGYRNWVTWRLLPQAPRSAAPRIENISGDSRQIGTYKNGSVQVSDGLLFGWAQVENGLVAAWDRPTRRVYYHRWTR